MALTGPSGLTFPDQSCRYLGSDYGEFKYDKNVATVGGFSDGIRNGVLIECQFDLGTEFSLSNFSLTLDDLTGPDRVSLLNKLSLGTDFVIKDTTPLKHVPTISGTPATTTNPGVAYSFTPTASDLDGDALVFSIKNMPPWASFNTTTGALTGTSAPKDYGIYSNIIISVTAGSDTVALPAFAVSVEDITKPIAVDISDGTFSTTQNVTLTCQDDGSGCSLIYYTLDGSTPTISSTLYSAPIAVSSSKVLKYIAVDKSGLVSDVRTKNFTINTALPTVTIIYPTDNSAFNSENSLSAISGSITDSSGVGILKVELQISDGTLFLVGKSGASQGFVPDNSSWVLAETANEWKNWYFVTSNSIWQSGKTYTITSRASDKNGKTVSTTSKFTYTDKFVVSGTIADAAGKAIPEVSITFLDENGKLTKSSDISGKYNWEAPKSGWSVKITPNKPGYTFLPEYLDLKSIKTNQLNSHFTAIAVESEQDARAIIVAGGDLKNYLWPATDYLATFAYKALRYKGITKDNIRYLSINNNQDIDNDHANDIYATSSSTDLKDSILKWAGEYVNDKRPLIIYMVDHGLTDKFFVTLPSYGQADIVTATDLQSWLTELQTKTKAKVILIMDTCFSGSFVKSLVPSQGMRRITIASADATQFANFSANGEHSFSGSFWKYVLQGNTLSESFVAASKKLQDTIRNQNPIMDADGDGGFIASRDFASIKDTYLGNPQRTGAVFPDITGTSGNAYMEEKASLPLWVTVNQLPENIDQVWGVVDTPGAATEGTDPVTGLPILKQLPILELSYNKSASRYEALFDTTQFTQSGQYIITFYARAKDDKKWVSLPSSITIHVGKDDFEPDNTPDQASIIVLNSDIPQHHNMHLVNDVDWVKFYALEGLPYEIQASHLGARSNVVLELYDTDKVTPIKTINDQGTQGDESDSFTPKKDGVYFLKISQHGNANIFGPDTEYDLKIFRPNGPILIPMQVLCSKPDKTPMAHALIRTPGNETAITDANGYSTIMTESNKSTVDLTVDGTKPPETQGIKVEFSGKVLKVTTSVTPTSNSTTTVPSSTQTSPVLDVDKSGAVDATDGVLLLRKLNGASTIDTGVVLPTGQTNSTVMTSINAIGTKLDVDLSGSVDATDGVLILRKLNGASTIDTGVVLPTGQNNGTVSTAIDAIRK
ncbi:MAG: chitobiase/beta-hexosaminidase C-terminal domain-containing protein [Magnetococcus sp. YQC-5]